ncbi:MAG: MBOAT family protein, partial [Prolixibacteraceae bacterium]|nr:MBOAT family protein [Prolixibacteraceae bacterium]
MLFNTIEFVIFLPIVIAMYYLIPGKYRWIMLLAASYFFYMSWKVEYIFLIVISTLIDYFSGILMEKRASKRSRLPFLIISLCSNLGLLFFFKYYNFASENLNLFFDALEVQYNAPFMNLLLPVGISFYTFQTLSYSIDVYFGRQKAEKHLGYFALYVSFFPQLVAGPIERFSNLTPQLKASHHFSFQNLKMGLRLILYGLFIKMVIADNLAGIVDELYTDPGKYATWDIIKGVLFYSFQIYCDFYGYSIIAIGSAKIMGINIMDNFRTPYLAKNIAEFWQRWHISLSTWFRDYLYLPLGGSRVKQIRWVLNILIVFVVSGIWHGANWTFLIWGALFGFIYLLEKGFNRLFNFTQNHRPFSPGHLLLALKTFVLVTFIWIFFR